MKRILLAAVAAATLGAGTTAADAAQGCGPGFHRGYYGRCIPNGGPGFYGPPRVGVFYPGRGYWYGHRYWGARYRWHGGWRYR